MKIGISVEEALSLICAHIKPLPAQPACGEELLGRGLAADVRAPMNQPPFDRSPLDGYALLSADTEGASGERPARLAVVDTVYAGGWSDVTLQRGQCVHIMTGAPIPQGADCVVRQEDVRLVDGMVEVSIPMYPRQNYCCAGEDWHEGQVLLLSGTRVDAAVSGVLAGAGLWNTPLPAHGVPSVLLVSTGDELARPDEELVGGRIYDANLPMLAARCRELGLTVTERRLPDDPQLVANGLLDGVEQFDCVITTGGVSVGERDIFHQALPLAGAERIFWRVALKPGTPLMFSLLGGKPILSLSGNPFAAAATFELFARPMLAALAGQDDWQPVTLSAPLANGFDKASGGRRFVRGRYESGRVTLPVQHSSGQLRSMVGCNCLVDIPAGSPPLAAGTIVEVILL